MCGPAVAWDWIVLDVSYILLLIGGAIILRTRFASTATWIMFGVLSIGVGGFLLGTTYHVQATAADVARSASTISLISNC